MAKVNLQDVAAANALLMSLGGEDQITVIATRAFDRSIELQERIDRALLYAQQAPPSSTHARQMARILDGSITVDDEASEIPEKDIPMRPRRAVESSARRKSAGKTSDERTKDERQRIREWLAGQGINLGRGRIPRRHLDAYDDAMAEQRRQRREARQQEQQQQQDDAVAAEQMELV